MPLIYCPDRSDGDIGSYNAYGRALGATRYAGYGYNWGPIGWRGGGLLNQQFRNYFGQSYITGKSIASVVSPAATFAFGDTYDTPRMTVGIGFSADTWNGTTNNGLRHSATFNYSFVDGHAKAVKVRAGFMANAFNNRLVMVRDTANLGRTAYCANPDEIIADGGASPDGTSVPTLACGDIPNWIVTNFPTCSAGSTSDCLFPD